MTVYVFTVAASVLLLDRFAKIMACNSLSQGQSVKVLDGIFHITLVFNKGAAFGLLKDHNFVFVSVSLLAIFFTAIYIFRNNKNNLSLSSALGLILGGAAGNLIDRVRFGYVIDFLDFRVWPVFNIADSCITVGTAMLVFNLLFKKRNA